MKKLNLNINKWWLLIGGIIGFLVSILPFSGNPTTEILLTPVRYIIKLLGLYSTSGEGNLFYLVILLPLFYIGIGLLTGGIVGLLTFKKRKK